MKKLIFVLITCSLFIFKAQAAPLDLYSENYALYNLNENKIIYEKDIDEKISIASLTKIMTALVTLENVSDLDEKVTLIYSDFDGLLEANLVTAGFYSGEVVTYRDLLYGLMLPSGADAAQALARLVGQTETNFVQMMNDKTKQLKLENTQFKNVTGLDAEGHYSTISDIAIIFNEALKNKDFKEIITTEKYVTSNERMTINNSILKRSENMGMDYILGGKTGTTDDAGLCLATIALENDINYMLITAGAPYDKKGMHNFTDAKTIYEYFTNNYGYQTLVKEDEIILKLKTKNAKDDEVTFKSPEDITFYLPNDYDKEKINYDYEGIEEITPNMDKNKKLGTLTITYDNEIVETINITLEEKITFSLFKFLENNKYVILLTGILIISILIICKVKRKKKKNKTLNK